MLSTVNFSRTIANPDRISREAIAKTLPIMIDVIHHAQSTGDVVIYDRYQDTVEYKSMGIYDALARLLHLSHKFKSTAVAIVNVGGVQTLYLSYNTNVDFKQKILIRDTFSKIQECSPSKDWKSLVLHCLEKNHKFYKPEEYHTLINSTDYLNKIGSSLLRYIDGDCYDLFMGYIKDFLELAKDSTLDLKAIKTTITNTTKKLTEITSLLSFIELPDELAEIFDLLEQAASRIVYFRKRLIQDCYKLLKYSDKISLSSIEDKNFIIIPNPDKVHCELNLREYLYYNKTLPRSYMGISKLSCFVCDTQFKLDEEATGTKLHAGGSGIAYPIEEKGIPASMRDEPEFKFHRKIKEKYDECAYITATASPGPDGAKQYHDFSDDEELFRGITGAAAHSEVD